MKNLDAGISRSPEPSPATVNTAPAAIQMGFRSEMGDPVHTLPPMLAVLRIWVPANQCSWLMMAWHVDVWWAGLVAMRCLQVSIRLDSVVEAPKVTPSSEKATSFSSGTWVVPTSTGYFIALNFISMPTSVLPTISLASLCLALMVSRDGRDTGRIQVAFGPGITSSACGRFFSSPGKMGSPLACPSFAVRILLEGAFTSEGPSDFEAPQSHGRPVEGQILPLPSPLAAPLPLATPLPLASPLGVPPLAAAMASSVYALASVFANTRNASRMGR
mmetsp:Transcript_25215/g.65461  ORF Transcript_25215/g.65461 Transcript_25215/m.65461 type:complete len:274 (-) Transcript_25215:201-1022(-)